MTRILCAPRRVGHIRVSHVARATFIVGALAVSAPFAGAQQNTPPAPVIVAENMRAVPSGVSAGTSYRPRPCHRVCVKAGRGSPTHEPPCVQWQVVC